MSRLTAALGLLSIVLMPGCSDREPGRSNDSSGVDPVRIETHMRALAADEFLGRETGSAGFMRAAEYVASAFADLGLEPAAQEAGFYQSVPLIAGSLLTDGSRLSLIRGGAEVSLEIQADFVIAPDLLRESSELTAPLVYVGFGVRAPTLEHDDYAGVDVRGKIAVMLDGAPDRFPHDVRAFHSKASMKQQTAAQLGALGVVTLMLPRDRVNSPWNAVVADHEVSAMRWLDPSGRPQGVQEELFVAATLSTTGEAKLFSGEERTLEQVFAAAIAGETSSFDLAARLAAFTATRHERLKSPNVIARLAGADATVADEHVVLTAHLDHVGSIPVEAGQDGIYNGAYDNASGVAMLLEVARALAERTERPRRSVLFVATTGEEKGLLGSEYFVEHPSIDLEDMVAEINLDVALMLHPLKDVVAFGAEHSSLGRTVELALREFGVKVSPDPIAEWGTFVRGDQYPFVEKGIPSIFLFSGFDAGQIDGVEQFQLWMSNIYHSPADDMDQTFDFKAGADFARVVLRVVTDVADAGEQPRWNAGDYFGNRFGNHRQDATEP